MDGKWWEQGVGPEEMRKTRKKQGIGSRHLA